MGLVNEKEVFQIVGIDLFLALALLAKLAVLVLFPNILVDFSAQVL